MFSLDPQCFRWVLSVFVGSSAFSLGPKPNENTGTIDIQYRVEARTILSLIHGLAGQELPAKFLILAKMMTAQMRMGAPPPSPTLDFIQRALSQCIHNYLGRVLGQGAALETPSSVLSRPAPAQNHFRTVEFAMNINICC